MFHCRVNVESTGEIMNQSIDSQLFLVPSSHFVPQTSSSGSQLGTGNQGSVEPLHQDRHVFIQLTSDLRQRQSSEPDPLFGVENTHTNGWKNIDEFHFELESFDNSVFPGKLVVIYNDHRFTPNGS